jgi:hypothetical protein
MIAMNMATTYKTLTAILGLIRRAGMTSPSGSKGGTITPSLTPGLVSRRHMVLVIWCRAKHHRRSG